MKIAYVVTETTRSLTSTSTTYQTVTSTFNIAKKYIKTVYPNAIKSNATSFYVINSDGCIVLDISAVELIQENHNIFHIFHIFHENTSF